MEIRLIARVMHLTEQYHERTHEVRLGNYSVPAVSRLFMRCDGCRIECGRIVRHGRVSRSSPGDPVLQLYVGQLGRVPLINPLRRNGQVTQTGLRSEIHVTFSQHTPEDSGTKGSEITYGPWCCFTAVSYN